MDFKISKVADTLISQSTIVGCSLEDTWKDWMHPLITSQFSFEEVKQYIDETVKLGEQIK